jgi:hypothetical protein
MQQLLTTLTLKHAELTSSYVQQSQTINELHKRMAEISAELELLRSQTWSPPSQQTHSHWAHSNGFDAFTFCPDLTLTQTPASRALDAATKGGLPLFENLVQHGGYRA